MRLERYVTIKLLDIDKESGLFLVSDVNPLRPLRQESLHDSNYALKKIVRLYFSCYGL
jgi:hypothetical protein